MHQWIEFETGESLAAYCDRMSIPISWGGVIELYLLTRVFGVAVNLWEPMEASFDDLLLEPSAPFEAVRRHQVPADGAMGRCKVCNLLCEQRSVEPQTYAKPERGGHPLIKTIPAFQHGRHWQQPLQRLSASRASSPGSAARRHAAPHKAEGAPTRPETPGAAVARGPRCDAARCTETEGRRAPAGKLDAAVLVHRTKAQAKRSFSPYSAAHLILYGAEHLRLVLVMRRVQISNHIVSTS